MNPLRCMSMEDISSEPKICQLAPIMLCNKLQEITHRSPPQITKLIKRNFHMNDFVKSVTSAEQAIEIYKLLRAMLAKGGFQLTKRISNCEQTMTSIDQDDKSPSSSKTFEAEPTSPSILGLQWNVDEDNLEVCRGMQNERPMIITQRAVLSHVSAVFDPLGIVSPFTIRMRLLLKSIWKENGQSWDKKLNEKIDMSSRNGHQR